MTKWDVKVGLCKNNDESILSLIWPIKWGLNYDNKRLSNEILAW